MKLIIPPNGFAGQVQQTQANQLVRTRGASAWTRTRRKKRKAAAPKKRATKRRTKRASSSRSAKPARLVKGSAAAKRYMAKLRRMRRK